MDKCGIMSQRCFNWSNLLAHGHLSEGVSAAVEQRDLAPSIYETRANGKEKGPAVISCEPFVCLVAGAGLEPTTFGL